jgi:hypothetical protein
MSDNNLYDKLIENCDCIAWIPTVRGSLSLDLLDTQFLLGDTDKFLVEFKYLQGFETSRYILATSLFAFSDSKYFNNIYCRAFRFIFRGSINDKHEIQEFCQKYNVDVSKIKEKELLIGKLSLVLNLSKNLTENEVDTLASFKSILGLNEKYQIDYIDKAVSLEELADQRYEMKKIHDKTVLQIKQFEDINTDDPNYRVWKFDILLSRDGILFLKDDTNEAFKKDYFEVNTSDDYTTNIPIHRCFKTAMTYIKYLFHNHYHHDKNNDSFLPVTNLHPLKKIENKGAGILNHQLEPFLQQITKHKRLSKNLRCNPIGISSYAKSFVDVLYYNSFISIEKRDKTHRFIQYQEIEAIEFLKVKEKARDFFITQNNFLASITVGFSFQLATIAIYKFFISDQSAGITDKSKIELLSGAFVFGYILQLFHVKRLIAGNFISPLVRKKKKGLRFLFKNSNLAKGKLSSFYLFYLWLTELEMKMTEIITTIIKIVLILISIVFLIYYYYQWMG